MNVETIIAIVTAGIAFITSVASFIYNLSQSRKERVQKIVLSNRITYLNEIRNGFTCIIGLCNLKAIRLAKENKDVMKVFSEKLFSGYGRLKAYIKPFYQIDEELLVALDDLYNCVLSSFYDDEIDAESIDRLRNVFTDKYAKYDWAYWKYIQWQKNGKYINSDDAFDKVYNEFVKEISK